jgi:hypothetical protein
MIERHSPKVNAIVAVTTCISIDEFTAIGRNTVVADVWPRKKLLAGSSVQINAN